MIGKRYERADNVSVDLIEFREGARSTVPEMRNGK